MKEIANRYTISLLSVIAVLALAAFSTPAMAGTNCTCDVSTHGTNPAGGLCSFGTNGTVNGTMYVDDGEGELGQDYVHVDFEAIPAGVNITWARVYWHIWMPGDWTKATFCNETQCSENNITICNPSGQCTCTQNETEGFYGGGCGTTWVYWNVTNNVTSGEQHNITIDNRAQGADGRTYWVILVAVLENSTKYSETHYWVNQGYEDSYPDDSSNKTTTWFNGTISNETNSTLWHLALCSDVTIGGLWFNDRNVRTDIPREMAKEEIDKSWIEADSTTHSMMWDNGDDDWFHPVMAILMDNITHGIDLIVEDIEFPMVMRPNTNHIINATIKNQGNVNASWFNVSLYVNDVENKTVNVTQGLNASKSTTVSFEDVNLSDGCYTFKVVADSGGLIEEVNENNNATSKKYQVGYVVVVKSDNDFADLVNDTGLPTNSVTYVSDTYYIQNLTITNCAGDGIYIVDTSKNFVINNCTIENCKPTASGVFLNNVTNGTINGSLMQNNTAYGVELGLVPLSDEDPKFINITNNNITENKLNGIDLIGFNCTVKDNNVTDNSVYGIYLFANHSNITNNNVTDNGNYGVKLYNSFGNYVYENNFTDNKASNPGYQAWDNGATNNNHWNTTAKGNWWSDWVNNDGWKDNSGFPNGTYKIDDGSNRDYKPEGPHGPTTTITVEVHSAEAVDNGDHTDVTGDVNQSENTYASIGAGGGDKEPYVQVNFSADIPAGSMINSVIFYYEHYEDAAIDWVRIYVNDSGNWDSYVAGEVNTAEPTDTADLTEYIGTEDEAEDVKVRYQIYNSGQVKDGNLDYAYLNITYTQPS